MKNLFLHAISEALQPPERYIPYVGRKKLNATKENLKIRATRKRKNKQKKASRKANRR